MGEDISRAIEAIVMVAEEPVPPNLLAQLLEVPVTDGRARRASSSPTATRPRDAASSSSKVAGGYRYQSHPDLSPYVERFVLEGQSSRLSNAALETLAIIAYKQPISRAQAASIRGVDVEAVVRTLQLAGLHRADRARPRPGPGRALGDDAAVPREARPRLARRPSAARRLRPRRRRGRSAGDHVAARRAR